MEAVEIEKKLEAIAEEARNEILAIAEEYRKNVLIPLCRKYKVTFLSGNGDWYFCKGNNIFRDAEDAASLKLPFKTFKLIFEGLSIKALGYDDYMGYYIASIYEEDIK